MGDRTHFEIAIGSAEDNIRYTSKEKDTTSCFFKIGNPPKQGERTDIMKAIAESKGNLGAFIEANPMLYVRYRNAMKELVRREALRVQTDWTKRVIWMRGPTGCGKTRKATDLGGNDYWINNANCQWFDNYEGQEVAILDDFRKE